MKRPGLVDPATAALVDRQMRNWELARSQRPVRPVGRRREVEDFVCVSRMVGVRDDIPKLLGRRLGWPVFDGQILAAMAGDDRRRRQIYESMDERDVGWWEDVLNPLIRDGFNRNDYFHKLCSTVLSLARQGSGVFVGRGLDRVLPSAIGFRVQLVAPLAQRVAWFAGDHELEAATARREIARVESERATFLRHHFGVEPADPLRFDLTLRVDRVAVEPAVETLLGARRFFAGAKPAAAATGTRG